MPTYFSPPFSSLNRRQTLASGLALSLGALSSPWANAQALAPIDEVWQDNQRQRGIPVRIRWPSDALPKPAGGWPVVLFSHGLGGTRAGGEVWGQAWAAAGFVVVRLQHPGSDLDAVRQVASSFFRPRSTARLGQCHATAGAAARCGVCAGRSSTPAQQPCALGSGSP